MIFCSNLPAFSRMVYVFMQVGPRMKLLNVGPGMKCNWILNELLAFGRIVHVFV